MKTLLLLSFLLWYSLAFSADTCEFKTWKFQNIQIQTGQFKSGECFVSLSNTKAYDLVFRSHLLTDEGLHLVFNSFGYGPSGSHTGAREFLYPGDKKFISVKTKANNLSVFLGNGHRIEFNPENLKLLSSSDITFIEDPVIQRNNAGGVTIESASFPIIDFGFRLGGSPRARLNNMFVYRYADKVCEFENKKIVKHTTGDLSWVLNPIGELNNVLEQECN